MKGKLQHFTQTENNKIKAFIFTARFIKMYLRNISLLSICLAICTVVRAQSITDTFYYDAGYAKTPKKKAVYFSPPAEKVGENHYRACFFLMDGTLAACEVFRAVNVRGGLSIYNREAVLDGAYICYFSNGNAYMTGQFKDGYRIGEWVTYYLDGKVKMKEILSEKCNEELVTFFDSLGHKTSEGKRVYHRKDKVWKEYGVWNWYFPNGNIYVTGQKEDGYNIGEWVTYYSDGKLDKKEVFSKKGNMAYVSLFDSLGYRSEGKRVYHRKEDVWKDEGVWNWYFPNGNVYITGQSKDGYQTGEWLTFYPDGKVEIKQVFSEKGKSMHITFFDSLGYKTCEGKRVYYSKEDVWKDKGIWNWYFSHSNAVSQSFTREGDVNHGPYIEYDSITGIIAARGTYINGKREGPDTVFFDGKIAAVAGFYKNDLEDGEWDFYTADGRQIASKRFYKAGIGKAVFLNPLTGDTIGIGNYKGDTKEGRFTTYFPGTRLIEKEYVYKEDLLDGYYKVYDKNGYLKEEAPFVAGKISGTTRINYPYSSKVWITQQFVNDTLDGLLTTFYRNGDVKRKAIFERGEFIEQTCYSLAKEVVPCEDMYSPARFNGDITNYIAKNLVYPSEAKAAKKEGKVVIAFVIDEDGKITNPVLKKGVNKYCDAEALRLISEMPKWEPAVIDGVEIRTYQQVTVPFLID